MKLVIALLMGLIAVSLCVSSTVASGYRMGYGAIGTTTLVIEAPIFPYYNNFTVTVPEGYCLDLKNFYVYARANYSTVNCHGAVYDEFGSLICETADISVSESAGWYSATIDGRLLAGNYYLGLGATVNFTQYYTAGAGDFGQFYSGGGYGFDGTVAINYGSMAAMSMYLEYEFAPVSGSVSVDSTSIGALAVAMFLVLLNVLLIIKPIPVLGFSVAMITFGSVLVILGYSMPYAGLFAMMLSVISVISIYRSAMVVRG